MEVIDYSLQLGLIFWTLIGIGFGIVGIAKELHDLNKNIKDKR